MCVCVGGGGVVRVCMREKIVHMQVIVQVYMSVSESMCTCVRAGMYTCACEHVHMCA